MSSSPRTTPRTPSRASRATPLGFPLTEADASFLARIEAVLDHTLTHLATLNHKLEAIALSPTQSPAPSANPGATPDITPVAYGRELNRALKSLHTLANIWTMIKTLQAQKSNANPDLTQAQASRMATLICSRYNAKLEALEQHYQQEIAKAHAAAAATESAPLAHAA